MFDLGGSTSNMLALAEGLFGVVGIFHSAQATSEKGWLQNRL